MRFQHINPFFWGCSIALSWTWGLGLFFSVQIAIQFGVAGLLAFAIPNALGLMAFGWLTQTIARKSESSLEFEKHFFRTVGNLRWVFLLYQVVAIALTFFALYKYVFLPLGVSPYLIALLMLGAGLLLGEQFKIAGLKWSHLAFSVIILLSILLIGWGGGSYFRMVDVMPRPFGGVEHILSHEGTFAPNWKFAGYFVPILVGFLLGPWLDIQQWQRAIQIRREHSSIRASYIFGGLLFFGILLFHGTLALAIWGEGIRLGITGALTQQTADGLFHAKDAVVQFLFAGGVEQVPVLFKLMYVIFLCLCIVSTLDSGYVALKWFQTDTIKKSDSIYVALIPKSFLESPVPPFVFAAVLGLVGLWLRFELEYFMAFYGSFSVGYALVFLFRTTFAPRWTAFTQTTLVSLAAFSLGAFGLGYFEEIWFLMAIGSLIPLAHAIATIATRAAVEEIKRTGIIEKIQEEGPAALMHRGRAKGDSREDAPAAAVAKAGSEEAAFVEAATADHVPMVRKDAAGATSAWFEGKWFVHSFTTTYQDTNSVGNVYFAQYAMWIGKTRELFFRYAIPNFDLKSSPWYILTRAFEHKFLKETTEFEQIEVKIRIAGFNRKFVTMEHQVFDSGKTMLGKGKQVLLFVSSEDYHVIDIPAELHKAFLPYV